MTIRRAIPLLPESDLSAAREFYSGFLGFEVAMDEPGFMQFRSPSHPSVQIIVGNDTPVVEFVRPVEGQPFRFGDVVQFEVNVTDDTPVDCNEVNVAYILGHDDHGHPLTASTGCSGTITTSAAGHEGEENLRAVFNASYTDAPTDPDVPPLTGSDEVVIPPTP